MSTEDLPEIEGPVCPVPLPIEKTIVMGHGSGGRLSHDLFRKVFLPYFDNPALRAGDDAASLSLDGCPKLAVSTDSHVVLPLFFPGGDIGRLAVCGTVNDVSMLGAIPKALTAGFILEEGFSVELLQRIVDSMRRAATEAGVEIIAGDTKVVQKGKADGMYINTTGIGTIQPGLEINGSMASPGDAVIISGTLGDHGIAVLAARGELGFETEVTSDVAPLNHMITALVNTCKKIHVLRDPTRGGLATSLNEIAKQSNVGIELTEETIPVKPEVAAACEMLGFDPLYIANEGKLIVIVAEEEAQIALQTIQQYPIGKDAMIIGQVKAQPGGRVLMKTIYGTTRVVDILAGEILPRIC